MTMGEFFGVILVVIAIALAVGALMIGSMREERSKWCSMYTQDSRAKYAECMNNPPHNAN